MRPFLLGASKSLAGQFILLFSRASCIYFTLGDQRCGACGGGGGQGPRQNWFGVDHLSLMGEQHLHVAEMKTKCILHSNTKTTTTVKPEQCVRMEWLVGTETASFTPTPYCHPRNFPLGASLTHHLFVVWLSFGCFLFRQGKKRLPNDMPMNSGGMGELK